MQRFSPEIPWVLVTPAGLGLFLGTCEACRARATGDQEHMAAFALGHREHAAPAGFFGLGDAVAALAKPIARALGRTAPCTPCEARRRAMNAARVRRLW